MGLLLLASGLQAGGTVYDSGWVADSLTHLISGLPPGDYVATVQDRDAALLESLESSTFPFTVAVNEPEEFPQLITSGFGPSQLSGGVGKQAIKITDAGLIPTASIAAVYSKEQLLLGGLTPAGVSINRVSRGLAAAIDQAGNLARQANKSMAGGHTQAGDLSFIRLVLSDFDGELSPIATMIKSTSKSLTGSPESIGDITRLTDKAFTGMVQHAGTVARRVEKLVTGSMIPTAIAVLRVAKTFMTTQVMAGTMLAQNVFLRAVTGAMGLGQLAGTVTRIEGKGFAASGNLTPTAAIERALQKSLDADITPTSTVGRLVRSNLQAAQQQVGSLSLQQYLSKSLAGTMDFEGSIIAGAQRRVIIDGELSLAAVLDAVKTVILSYLPLYFMATVNRAITTRLGTRRAIETTVNVEQP